MKNLKFRQAIFVDGKFMEWHYWGFIREGGNLTFVMPEITLSSIEEAYKDSYQYTERKTGEKELYAGDIVKWVNNLGEENTGWIRYTRPVVGFYVVLIKGSYISFYTGSEANFAWGDLKIIGNISKNPEMVEEKG